MVRVRLGLRRVADILVNVSGDGLAAETSTEYKEARSTLSGTPRVFDMLAEEQKS